MTYVIMEGPEFGMPATFREYWRRGWLNVTEYSNRDSFSTDSYIWLNDMEWDLRSVPEYLLRYKRGTNKIIPFARTGGGDLWGYHVTDETRYNPPVVICYHDDGTCEFYSPDIESAVFRQILSFCSDPLLTPSASEQTHLGMSIELARRHLVHWNETYGIFFPVNWRHLIRQLATKEPSMCRIGTVSCSVILTPDDIRQYENLIARSDRFGEVIVISTDDLF